MTKPVARVEVRKVTPRSRICSTQGWKIRSPTLPLHHLTSKEVWCLSTKKYAMPRAAAAEHWLPRVS